MTDNSIHFQHENLGDQMRRNREELYTLTFARDYGFKAVGYAIAQLGAPKFFEEVGRRAEARIHGRISMDTQGNEHLQGALDLGGFGFGAEQLAHIEVLKQAEESHSVAAAPGSFVAAVGGAKAPLARGAGNSVSDGLPG